MMGYGRMKRIAVIIMCLMMLAGCANSDISGIGDKTISISASDVDVHALSDNITVLSDFTQRLFANVLESDKENPVISPVSAYIALAMASDGAEGETLSEFEQLLGMDKQSLETFSRDLMVYLLDTRGNTTLTIANSVWVDKKLPLKDTFVDSMGTYFNADVFSEDFSANSTVSKINKWVSKKTNGKIKEVLDSMKENAASKLINTVCLDATWAKKFKRSKTYTDEFTLQSGDKIKTKFMQNDEDSDEKYINNGTLEGVVLPYNDDKYAFMALKTVDGSSIRNIMMTQNIVKNLYEDARSQPVDLKVPKMDIAFSMELIPVLQEMGIISALGSGADFSAMTDPDKDVFIDSVLQEVRIEVDESGVKAAAATKIDYSYTTDAEEPAIDLKFDSPFFYCVFDIETGAALFMGIMDDPSL